MELVSIRRQVDAQGCEPCALHYQAIVIDPPFEVSQPALATLLLGITTRVRLTAPDSNMQCDLGLSYLPMYGTVATRHPRRAIIGSPNYVLSLVTTAIDFALRKLLVVVSRINRLQGYRENLQSGRWLWNR